jgi:hypothetical protein
MPRLAPSLVPAEDRPRVGKRPARVAEPSRRPAAPPRRPPVLRHAERIAVVWRPVASLTPNPFNARVHSAEQVAAIAESIAAFGFNAPILVDGAGRVLAGHGRLLAAERLGLAEAPTIALEHLNEAERRAFMLADNRLAERSGWDKDRLALEFRALTTLDLDFSLSATGFALDDIDLRLNPAAPRPGSETGASGRRGRAPAGPAEASAPGPAQAAPQPVARAGDTWALGPHRLVCADAPDPAALAAADAAIRAWQAATGDRARLMPALDPFDAVARARAVSLTA